jgi:hypothetical protein
MTTAINLREVAYPSLFAALNDRSDRLTPV